MTWKLTVHSNPGSTVTADYECPVHGRFELTIERDPGGDPPSEVTCQLVSWSVSGYNDEYASLEDAVEAARALGLDPETAHYETQRCADDAPWVASAPGHVKVKAGEVVRGKSDARPSDRHVMDTSLIADGMPLDEFKRRRAAVHRDESLRRVRGALGRGPKVWSR